jgi:hypothetical protein
MRAQPPALFQVESLYAGQDCAFALHGALPKRATQNWPGTLAGDLASEGLLGHDLILGKN